MAHNAATTEPTIQNAITKIRATKNSALKNSIGASKIRTSSRLSGLEKLDVRFERVSREALYSEAPRYRHGWACVGHRYSSAFFTPIHRAKAVAESSVTGTTPIRSSFCTMSLYVSFRVSVCRSICMDACRNKENVKTRNDCVKFGKVTTTSTETSHWEHEMRINTGAELELRLHLPQTMPAALEPGVFSRALWAPELPRLPRAEISVIATKASAFSCCPVGLKRLSSSTERSSRPMSLVRGS